jgi:hypothetical protein
VPKIRRDGVGTDKSFRLTGWRGAITRVKSPKDGQLFFVKVRPDVETSSGGIAFLSTTFEETWRVTKSKMTCVKCEMNDINVLITN